MTDIKALIAEGKKAALSAAHDDCLLLSDLVHELEAMQSDLTERINELTVSLKYRNAVCERQQAVVEAAQRYTKSYDEACDKPSGEMWSRSMADVEEIRKEVKSLAALDAAPEGDGTK